MSSAYVKANTGQQGPENPGVLQYFNSVYDDLNNINNDNLINENNAKYNLYNYKKTKMYIQVLYVVIITCLILLVVTFLRKQNNYFDDTAYLIVVGISLGIACCYILYLVKDIMFRDNMNFDEYDYSRYGSGSNIDASANAQTSNTNKSKTNCKTKGTSLLSFF